MAALIQLIKVSQQEAKYNLHLQIILRTAIRERLWTGSTNSLWRADSKEWFIIVSDSQIVFESFLVGVSLSFETPPVIRSQHCVSQSERSTEVKRERPLWGLWTTHVKWRRRSRWVNKLLKDCFTLSCRFTPSFKTAFL